MQPQLNSDVIKTNPGNPYLLGAAVTPEGCNFAVFSKHGTSVSLFLFDHYRDQKPAHILKFDPILNKTGDIWHIFIYGVISGQLYGYSVDGPYDPAGAGHRFNSNKLLLDPYTRAVSGKCHWKDTTSYGYEVNSPEGDLSFSRENNWNSEVKSIVVDDSDFDWMNDRHPLISMHETIIYETHVRAFTVDPSSRVRHSGTYLGMIDKIPYLKELGVTTIELLPVHEFNEEENFRMNPLTGEKLKNFWGYSTLAFFAPDTWYSTNDDGITAVREFKEMVRAFHKEGMEIILDVVYNHTGEGNEYGPTLSFRGLDNAVYYMLENGRSYINYSGCGNTLNCSHVVVKNLILDSLRYWVIDMHVDGFRFDLAAILGRDSDGNWIPNHSILKEITEDPILSNTKIIAEGWDVRLFQVGGFPRGWAEWNAHFRDDVRSFLKGDDDKIKLFMNRLTGSADLFSSRERAPYNSINFISAHDGFTLNDLVSYNTKHNEANGESNIDGLNDNLSWNCGIEGDTDDPSILALRDRQMKNFITLLMLSQGTPMVLAGDEMKFSKMGNNNTYCQDNSYNWINWNLLEQNSDFFKFCKHVIHFRKEHPVFRRHSFFSLIDHTGDDIPDLSWHGVKLVKPDISSKSHTIAFLLDGDARETSSTINDNNIYISINAYWEQLTFQLPDPRPGKNWYVCIDTGVPEAFYPEGLEKRIQKKYMLLESRSLVVLIEK